MPKFRPWTQEQKTEYSKQFTARERAIYQRGKRNGFLEAVHNPNVVCKNRQKKDDFIRHTFTKEDFDAIYDDLENVKLT